MKLIAIYWVDSSSIAIGWHKGETFDLSPIITVGFLIEDAKEHMAISHSIGKTGLVYDAFIIPKGCIREVVDLDTKKLPQVFKQTDGKG
jgi:hypothetical protein